MAVDQRVPNTSGGVVEESAVEAFRAGLRGELLRPGDDGYEGARTVWNALVDRRPALVARCRGAADARTGCSCPCAAAGTASPAAPSPRAG
jgi:hypothetical protein